LGLSTYFGASGSMATSARSELQPVDQGKQSEALQRQDGHRRGGHRGRALGIFKQELRMTLRAQFNPKLASAENPYTRAQSPATSDEVADEALAAARQLVAEAPAKAAKSLISFRATVQETASYVRKVVGISEDMTDVDNTVAKVGEGLDALEGEVALNRESSASVLSIDTRSKQRSTISIRTQEGDIVKLSLMRKDSLSARDVAVSNGSGRATSTEIEVSSRSRMMLKVDGDLNESELAAIRNVFAKAEQIADDFFGGDMAKAFSLAQGFEFDTEQLSRVSLQFKVRQVSDIAYAESMPPRIPPRMPPESLPALSATEPVTAPVIAPQTVTDASTGVAASDSVEVAAQPGVNEPAALPAPDTSSALADFFDSLSAFLRSVGDGFAATQGSGSFTVHYSESFKLNLLKAAINTLAPEQAADAAANAEAVIDEVSE
jgi:hypothetical protein